MEEPEGAQSRQPGGQGPEHPGLGTAGSLYSTQREVGSLYVLRRGVTGVTDSSWFARAIQALAIKSSVSKKPLIYKETRIALTG